MKSTKVRLYKVFRYFVIFHVKIYKNIIFIIRVINFFFFIILLPYPDNTDSVLKISKICSCMLKLNHLVWCWIASQSSTNWKHNLIYIHMELEGKEKVDSLSNRCSKTPYTNHNRDTWKYVCVKDKYGTDCQAMEVQQKATYKSWFPHLPSFYETIPYKQITLVWCYQITQYARLAKEQDRHLIKNRKKLEVPDTKEYFRLLPHDKSKTKQNLLIYLANPTCPILLKKQQKQISCF